MAKITIEKIDQEYHDWSASTNYSAATEDKLIWWLRKIVILILLVQNRNGEMRDGR